MNNSPKIDAIKTRSSWRSYDAERAIPAEKVTQIKEYLISQSQNGPFGNKARFQLIKVSENERSRLNSEYGTYGFIKGAEFFIGGAIPQATYALEDFGYLLERIIILATELGLGTCWLGGTFKRSLISQIMDLKENEILPAITPIGVPSENRRLYGKIIRAAARAKNRKSWNELFFDELFHPLDPEAVLKKFKLPLEMVRIAPSAKNKQPWRIAIDSDNRAHFFIATEPGRNLPKNYQKLDIGIAMYHFEISMRETGNIGKWIPVSPGLKYDSQKYHYVVTWLE